MRGAVVWIEPGKVVIQLKKGEVKSFTLSQDVKDNKSSDGFYALLHRQLILGMQIEVDSLRKNGVDEAQGYRFIAPPPDPNP
jgi:hypothetical protein